MYNVKFKICHENILCRHSTKLIVLIQTLQVKDLRHDLVTLTRCETNGKYVTMLTNPFLRKNTTVQLYFLIVQYFSEEGMMMEILCKGQWLKGRQHMQSAIPIPIFSKSELIQMSSIFQSFAGYHTWLCPCSDNILFFLPCRSSKK